MNEQQAQEFGRQSRIANRNASPLNCPEMLKELEEAKVGEKTHLMKAFSRGWHKENERITDQELRAEGLL